MAFYLFGQLIDGLLDLGWVNGSEVEPNPNHVCVSSVILSRLTPCLSSSLTFSPSVVASLVSVLATIFIELVSGLRFHFSALVILRCNTFHIFSFQFEHTPAWVILMFVFADLPANDTRGQGSHEFT